MVVAVVGSELARLRSDLESTMIEMALVERPTRTSDGKGGYTNDWATVGNYPCRRRPATETRGSGMEVSVGDRVEAISYWLFSFPAGTDVRPTDRITIGERVYQVNAQLDKSLEIARYVLAVEQL